MATTQDGRSSSGQDAEPTSKEYGTGTSTGFSESYREEAKNPDIGGYSPEDLLDDIYEELPEAVGQGERGFTTGEAAEAFRSRYESLKQENGAEQESFVKDTLRRLERRPKNARTGLELLLGEARKCGDVTGEWDEEGYRWRFTDEYLEQEDESEPSA